MRDKREVINVKRILSLVLSLCLVMTMMPAAYAGGTAYGAEKLEGAACGSTEGCTGVYDNGFCTACGGYQPAVLNEASFYEISNAGQLYWFAEFVNGDSINSSANALLKKNIVINENVLNGDGTLISNGASLRKWTPMGTSESPFRGWFWGKVFPSAESTACSRKMPAKQDCLLIRRGLELKILQSCFLVCCFRRKGHRWCHRRCFSRNRYL